MKKYLFLLCLIPAAGMFTTTPKSSDITLNIICKTCAGKDMDAFSVNFLANEPKTLFRSKFDSTGVAEIKLDGADTLVIYLNLQNKDSSWVLPRIYLEPGTRLDINVQKGVAAFHGDLGTVNSYLQKTLAVYRKEDKFHEESKFRDANYDKIQSASDRETETYLSTLGTFGRKLDDEIEHDQALSPYYKDLLINVNGEFVTEKRLLFNFHKLVAEMGEGVKKYSRNANVSEFFSGISINPYLLKAKASSYVFKIQLNANLKLYKLFDYYEENVDHKKISKYEFIKSVIAKTPRLVPYAEFFMAACLSTDAFLTGIAYDELLETVNAFEKDYPRSAYLPYFKETLKEQESLKAGMPLRDFTMINVEGDTLRLSDLKGKLIYIDVWATWCGPCVEELKYSKRLVNRYTDRKDLLFLYISQDRDLLKWKNFLKKNPTLTGLHAVQPQRDMPVDENDIAHLYKINGIPRYILIGKDGNIINYNAARPSELVTNNYLDSLLAL